MLHYADVPAAAGVEAAAVAGAVPAVPAVQAPPAAGDGPAGTQFAHAPAAAGEAAVVLPPVLCIKFVAALTVVVTAVVLALGVHVVASVLTTHAAQSPAAVPAVAPAVAFAVAFAVADAAQIHEHPLFQCTAPLFVVDMYLRTNVPPHESVTHSCLRLQLIL